MRQVDLVYIFTLIIAGWCIYGLSMARKKSYKKVTKNVVIIGWFSLTLAFLFGTFVMLLNHDVTQYHELPSPDKKYKLVVKESAFLLLSEISLCERKNIFFIEKIEDSATATDDGYLPISQDSYWVKWDKNVVILAIDGNCSDGSWTTIKVTFGENKHKVKFGTIYPNGKPSNMVDNSSENQKDNKNQSDDKKELYDEKDEKLQDKLDNVSIDNIIKIPNSEFGIIQVDKAMSSVQWFFVKISRDEMIFISELPDTKTSIDAKIDKKGSIIIKFEDINGNISKYKSVDNGKSWIEI